MYALNDILLCSAQRMWEQRREPFEGRQAREGTWGGIQPAVAGGRCGEEESRRGWSPAEDKPLNV